MRKKLTNNIGLKILSVLLACISWLVIINIEDPTITARINGITVTVTNEEAITSADKCYEITSTSTVNIIIKGKKSVVDRLTALDFTATADLSKYSITNAVPIEVSLNKKLTSNPEIIEGKNQTLMIKLEDYVVKQFNVESNIKGAVGKGFYLGTDEVTISPNRINISGPESVVKKVATVRVDVDVNGITADSRTIAKPRAYDSGGVIISSDKLEFGVTSVNVTASPLPTKELSVGLILNGNLPDGYVMTDNQLSVTSITVAGSTKALKKAKNISLVVNVSELDKDFSTEFDLSSMLTDGVKIVSNSTTAQADVKIEQMLTKNITFQAKDIKFLNLKQDVTTNYDSDSELIVSIRGMSDTIDELSIENLAPHIDFENLRLGNQNAEVQFDSVEGVEILESPTLRIELVRANNVPSTPLVSNPPATVEPTAEPTQEPATENTDDSKQSAEPKSTVAPVDESKTKAPNVDNE